MFTKTTVNSIIDTFEKTLNKLERHRVNMVEEANGHQVAIQELLDKRAVAISEAERAERVSKKLAAIVL